MAAKFKGRTKKNILFIEYLYIEYFIEYFSITKVRRRQWQKHGADQQSSPRGAKRNGNQPKRRKTRSRSLPQ